MYAPPVTLILSQNLTRKISITNDESGVNKITHFTRGEAPPLLQARGSGPRAVQQAGAREVEAGRLAEG